MSIKVSGRTSLALASTGSRKWRLARLLSAIVMTVVLMASTAFAQGGYYVGEVTENSNGTYNALLEHYPFDTAGSADSTEHVGTYSNKRAARRAAREAEREANSFMAEGCPPDLLC